MVTEEYIVEAPVRFTWSSTNQGYLGDPFENLEEVSLFLLTFADHANKVWKHVNSPEEFEPFVQGKTKVKIVKLDAHLDATTYAGGTKTVVSGQADVDTEIMAESEAHALTLFAAAVEAMRKDACSNCTAEVVL